MKPKHVAILFGLAFLVLVVAVALIWVLVWAIGPQQEASYPVPTETDSMPRPITTPTPTPVAGIAATREDFVNHFEYRHKFKDWKVSRTGNGEVVFGTSPDGYFELMLSSSASNEQDLDNILVSIGAEDSETAQRHFGYLSDTLSLAVPDWKDGDKWVLNNLNRQEAKKTYHDLDITMSWMRNPVILVVTIEER